jgi:hypothetical protein
LCCLFIVFILESAVKLVVFDSIYYSGRKYTYCKEELESERENAPDEVEKGPEPFFEIAFFLSSKSAKAMKD